MAAKPSLGPPGAIGVDDISGHGVLKASRATRKSQIRQMTKKPKICWAKRPLRVTKASDETDGSFEESLKMQPKHGQESSDRFGSLCIGHGDENNHASPLQFAEDQCRSPCGVRTQPQGHDIQQQEGQSIGPQETLAVEETVFISQDLEVLHCEPQECGPFILEKEAERGGEERCGSASLRLSVAGLLAEQPHPCPKPGKKKSRSGSTQQNTRGETNTSSYSHRRQNSAKCRWKTLASSILLAKNSASPVSISETLMESQSLSSENHISIGQNFSNEAEQIRSAESGQSHAIEVQPRKRRRTATARIRSTELKMQKVQTLNVMESQSPSCDNPQSLGDNFANESMQIGSADSGDSQATELRRKNGKNASAASANQNISAESGDSKATELQCKSSEKVSKQNMQQVQKQQVRILSRMKTFFTEAKFLQTQNEDNDTMDKEAFIMREDQRHAFAKAMVQSCQKNAKMRNVFLESVRKLTASGLMQTAAAKLLQKGSFEEAQQVMDVWGNFQQKRTLTLPVNLFNAVNQLHERGELSKELRETEESGIGAFHQMDEKAWRFSLPQLPAEESK